MDVLGRTPAVADHRIHYGPGEFQFGDLRLPAPGRPAPLVVFVHGGWWKSEYDLTYGGHLCHALKADGIATWSLEYRRVGDAGGGWPGTFQDVAAGFDYVATLAKSYPLDLSRVIVMGHSAGGHLAFWLAGRHHIPESSPLYLPRPIVPVHGAISLAGAVDLRLTIELAGYFTFAHDKQEVYDLMGGSPKVHPDRYAAGDPGELVPLNVPQALVQGAEDSQIPPQLPARWAERGRRLGEQVTVRMVPNAGHFEVVDPESAAWQVVRASLRDMLK
ncbi:Acetyl esterase/lipase [Granulicella rosea]|uniref:Acetyl esterase/lipase n=1 Tax=Granulicella rosea TaxID=474952 RepID=A0A239GY53_9BACT|nr:alpha/beta hydrolase [Granulicella rosea]SNS73805.1 Acetyl esterase/lipase [Granulicella rosea]